MNSTDFMIAACALLAIAMVSASILVGWQGWLSLKTRELDLRRVAPTPAEGPRPSREGAARIELADLKERVRRLEAIANGVDL